MSRNSDEQDILARLPKTTDADEVRITRRISDELLKTEWASELFGRMREAQKDFFKFAINSLDDPDQIYSKNQDLLKKLAEMSKAKIVSGADNLTGLRAPFFIVSNHLGDYKLAAIKPEELGIEMGVDQIHPFPMYYSSYSPVTEKLNAQISAAHVALLEPLLAIERACGLVPIVVKKEGDTLPVLEEDTRRILEKHSDSALVVFPEGGTSGKRNGRGPYDLEEFRAGAFVIAGHLGLPVLPVAKYFNPDSGYELDVFPVIVLEKDKDRGYYKDIAIKTQDRMQAWLDTRKSS